MKLLVSVFLLCCAATLGAAAESDVAMKSLTELDDDDFVYYPDRGIEENLFEQAMERLDAQDFENLPSLGEEKDDKLVEDSVTGRLFKTFFHDPHHIFKKRKPKRPPLKVELKAFRRRNGAASYKIYILQGTNIRHYRVNFGRSQRRKLRRSVQRKTRRCLIRKYTKKCIDLPFFFKRNCTTVITKACSGRFESFEIADPKTRGKNKTEPAKKHKPVETVKPRPVETRRPRPVEEPILPPVETDDPPFDPLPTPEEPQLF